MWPWWVKIPTEDFIDETLAIDDTQGGGDWGVGQWSWRLTRWPMRWPTFNTFNTDLTDVTLVSVTHWVKIPTEDYTDKTLAIDDTYEDDVREIVVLVMEVDKVVDEVTDVEIDQ